MKRSVVRRDKHQWAKIMTEQEQSGLGVAAFCRRESLGIASFYQWRRRLSGDNSPVPAAAAFIDMGQIEESTGGTSGSLGAFSLDLDFGGGLKLMLRRD